MYICSTDSCPSKVNGSFCCRFHFVQLLYVFGNTDHRRMWLELGAETIYLQAVLHDAIDHNLH
jgi:hypothetical protein